MMTPTLVLDAGRPRLVVGSAGSVRLAGAIAQVTWRILHGSPSPRAIHAPRLHVDGATLHLEGGWPDAAVAELPGAWDVVRWDGLNLYFGGVQAVRGVAGSDASRPPATRAAEAPDGRRMIRVRRATPRTPRPSSPSRRASRARRGAGS